MHLRIEMNLIRCRSWIDDTRAYPAHPNEDAIQSVPSGEDEHVRYVIEQMDFHAATCRSRAGSRSRREKIIHSLIFWIIWFRLIRSKRAARCCASYISRLNSIHFNIIIFSGSKIKWKKEEKKHGFFSLQFVCISQFMYFTLAQYPWGANEFSAKVLFGFRRIRYHFSIQCADSKRSG